MSRKLPLAVPTLWRQLIQTIEDPDAVDLAPVHIHATEGHSNVSRPPAPKRLNRLSELIDPMDLPAIGHVRSPSGDILGAEEYFARPSRPRSIRERQETIREKVAAASRLAFETTFAEETELVQQPKKNFGQKVRTVRHRV